MKYGEQAQIYMRDNGAAVSLTVVAVLIVGFAAYLLVANGRTRKKPIN